MRLLVGEDLARAQWRSARRLAALDPAVGLHPTHGFGSFCAGSTADLASGVMTIGGQHVSNPVLSTPQEKFVAGLLAGFGPVPRYYTHMASLNRAGAGAQPVREPFLVAGEELAAVAEDGDWVIDLRSRSAYADAHLAGTVNVEYGAQFATYVGWLAPWGGRHVLLVNEAGDLEAAARDLAGIGIDGLRAHGRAGRLGIGPFVTDGPNLA